MSLGSDRVIEIFYLDLTASLSGIDLFVRLRKYFSCSALEDFERSLRLMMHNLRFYWVVFYLVWAQLWAFRLVPKPVSALILNCKGS